MKVLRADMIGGASGDMILGAMMDLGVDRAKLETVLNGLGIGPVRLRMSPACDHGLTGVRLVVETDPPAEAGSGPHAHRHAERHGSGHGHRSHASIRELLHGAELPAAALELALSVFQRLAEAEGQIHGVRADEVTFHEIGAADSIADIVGACLAYVEIGSPAVDLGPFPLGRGEIHCAHGIYPLPAPAVVELLKGCASVDIEESVETVTPTGAAILVEWAASAPPPGPRRILAAGHGFGRNEMAHRPNALRLVLMESDTAPSDGDTEDCLVLETQIDDASGEWVGALAQRLASAGALDVFTVPVLMKKQRPGVLLTVLCRPDLRDPMLDLLFRHGTTFGVRERVTRRTVLARRWVTAATPYGAVRVKLGEWHGDVVTRAPEMDDCVARAEAAGVAPREVYAAALRATDA